MVWKARKHDPEFGKMLAEHMSLDPATGAIKLNGVYASLHIDIAWKGNVLQIPYSHIVWFLTYGRWPKDGYQLDHDNDDPFDNRPSNLNEVTHGENQRKRRGRAVNRNYGKSSKYGYGITLTYDKRDGKYNVRRYLSRGHGNGELKTINKGLGGYRTIEEAEARVAEIIELIKVHGLDYLPEHTRNRLSWKTIQLRKITPRIRRWRAEGQTIENIAIRVGYSQGTIHKIVKDVGVDKRSGRND